MTIPPAAKRHIIGRMRAAVTEHYLSTLLRKRDQGKVLRRVTQGPSSPDIILGFRTPPIGTERVSAGTRLSSGSAPAPQIIAKNVKPPNPRSSGSVLSDASSPRSTDVTRTRTTTKRAATAWRARITSNSDSEGDFAPTKLLPSRQKLSRKDTTDRSRDDHDGTVVSPTRDPGSADPACSSKPLRYERECAEYEHRCVVGDNTRSRGVFGETGSRELKKELIERTGETADRANGRRNALEVLRRAESNRRPIELARRTEPCTTRKQKAEEHSAVSQTRRKQDREQGIAVEHWEKQVPTFSRSDRSNSTSRGAALPTTPARATLRVGETTRN
ncbi:hypothetical protein WN51_05403 [Melipona quadrifasciata]|uniref:Uncharacterized protein n=1 Tax=Melipona quadrifasciata TaxID=166423 RepID=A0A0M8ZV33_9HYME|nr:hypothetical protein WN51_05403 [Melipona quadrifasciata]